MSYQWYGYRYKPSGEYQVKIYTDYRDIIEARDVIGETVYWVSPHSFEASSRREALDLLICMDYARNLSRACGIEPPNTLGHQTIKREDTNEDLMVELKQFIESMTIND